MLSRLTPGTIVAAALFTSCAEETCEHRGDCGVAEEAREVSAGGEAGADQRGTAAVGGGNSVNRGGAGAGGTGTQGTGGSSLGGASGAGGSQGGRGGDGGASGSSGTDGAGTGGTGGSAASGAGGTSGAGGAPQECGDSQCAIEEECVDDGAQHPARPCLACIVAESAVGWSPRTGDACNDGRWCNGTDSCTAEGECAAGSSDPCAGGDACNNTCSEDERNCLSPSKTSCSDGFFCTLLDMCDGAGRCVGAGDPCKLGDACNRTCNEELANCFSPNTTSCDDERYCTATDKCDGAGSCFGTGDPCASGDVCNDQCNERTNDCFAPDSRSCNDGLFCTEADKCDGLGACEGSGDPCTAPNTCDETQTTCLPPWPPESGIFQLDEKPGGNVVVGPGGLSVAWQALAGDGRIHGYWRSLMHSYAEPVDLGTVMLAADQIAVADDFRVAFVTGAGEICEGTGTTESFACSGSEVRAVALSPDGEHIAYVRPAEIVIRHLASGKTTTIPLTDPANVSISNRGKSIAFTSGGRIWFAEPPDATPLDLGDGFGARLAQDGGRIAFETLAPSVKTGPPGALVEITLAQDPAVAAGGAHIAYATADKPSQVLVGDVAFTEQIMAADGSASRGDCYAPSLSSAGRIVGLTCESDMESDGSPVDKAFTPSLAFVVWLQ